MDIDVEQHLNDQPTGSHLAFVRYSTIYRKRKNGTWVLVGQPSIFYNSDQFGHLLGQTPWALY